MRLISGDRVFLSLTLALAIGGFAVFSSASLGLLARNDSISKDILIQAGLGLGLGLGALTLARLVKVSLIRTYAPWVYALTLLTTALVFVPGLGHRSGGATRWIDLGFTTMQPAEFLKIGVILMLAWWLARVSRDLRDPRRGLFPFVAIIGLPAVLLLAQPNTSTTVLIALTGGAMYFAAGAPWRDLGILAVLAVIVLGGLLLTRGYVLSRFTTFFDPSHDPLNSSYQIQQSLIAIGSGQLTGRGFGQSVEKFNYLPEPSGDSVFAVYAEETGFIGSILLLALFVGLAARGIAIAGEARELFGGLIVLGASVILALQAFINIGAMVGIIPLTGLPLPFVSDGGTALLAALLLCGLVLNVAAQRKST